MRLTRKQFDILEILAESKQAMTMQEIGKRINDLQGEFNQTFEDLTQSGLNELGIPVFDAKLGGQYAAGDITCTLLGPVRKDYENLNDVSAVVRVDVGGVSMLVSGDSELEGETDVLRANDPVLLDCDIYQVGHHGSSTSTSLEFYTAISPDHCVISCGYGNSYGHPHTTVLQLLTLSGAEVYRTDTEGTIVLDTDGKTITRRGKMSWETESEPAA